MQYAWFITDEEQGTYNRVSPWTEGKVATRKLKDDIIAGLGETCRLELHSQSEAGTLKVQITFVPDEAPAKAKPEPAEEPPPRTDDDITTGPEDDEDAPEPDADDCKAAKVHTKDTLVVVSIAGAKLHREYDNAMKASRAAAGIRTVLESGAMPEGLKLFSVA